MSLRNSSWVLRRRIHLGISILKSLLLWVPMSRSTYALHPRCAYVCMESVSVILQSPFSSLCTQLYACNYVDLQTPSLKNASLSGHDRLRGACSLVTSLKHMLFASATISNTNMALSLPPPKAQNWLELMQRVIHASKWLQDVDYLHFYVSWLTSRKHRSI